MRTESLKRSQNNGEDAILVIYLDEYIRDAKRACIIIFYLKTNLVTQTNLKHTHLCTYTFKSKYLLH